MELFNVSVAKFSHHTGAAFHEFKMNFSGTPRMACVALLTVVLAATSLMALVPPFLLSSTDDIAAFGMHFCGMSGQKIAVMFMFVVSFSGGEIQQVANELVGSAAVLPCSSSNFFS